MGNWRGFSLFLVILIVGFILFLLFFIFVARANNQISVEANIISQDRYTMISVEDSYLYFGNVSKGGSSSSESTCINNTGSEDVNVEFDISPSGGFSNYVFMRNYSSGSYVPLEQYNLFLGTSGSERRKCVRFIINITDYAAPIYSPITNYQANITAIAVPV